MRRKRIFITGAFGQLGDAVIREFHSGFDVLAADLSIPPPKQSPCKTAVVDITDHRKVRAVLKEFVPDVVINLAALTDVDGCERSPELAEKINVGGVENILDCFQGLFIHISTDYVFDGKEGPYDEKAQTNPINVYGCTKLQSEKLVQSGSADWVIIRTNVVFDYNRRTRASFVKWVVDSLRAGTPIRVVDDQWNNPTWTVALAEVIHKIIREGVTGLYHYGGADYLHRLEFAKRIADVFHLDRRLITPISTADLNQLAPRPLKCGLKTNKIESKLNVNCIPIDTSLKAIHSKLQK
ncbi:MAG: SDR family oxidoreductase [FCB group bacterium]|nr:SDR family oxidoreductase [FCB group bacterium]